jgi:hypothetical protein
MPAARNKAIAPKDLMCLKKSCFMKISLLKLTEKHA